MPISRLGGGNILLMPAPSTSHPTQGLGLDGRGHPSCAATGVVALHVSPPHVSPRGDSPALRWGGRAAAAGANLFRLSGSTGVKGRLEGRGARAARDAHWRGTGRQLEQAQREKNPEEMRGAAREASVGSKEQLGAQRKGKVLGTCPKILVEHHPPPSPKEEGVARQSGPQSIPSIPKGGAGCISSLPSHSGA